jgi:hypothetical protein
VFRYVDRAIEANLIWYHIWAASCCLLYRQYVRKFWPVWPKTHYVCRFFFLPPATLSKQVGHTIEII